MYDMDKKEIIIVTISLGNDGAERVLSELANEWASSGHQVTVVQTRPNAYGCEYTLSERIEQLQIEAPGRFKIIRYLREIFKLVKILKKRPEACAVSFLSASSFILAVSSWFTKNRLIFSERNNPRECPAGIYQQILRNFAFYFADVCVFQTEDAKQYFSRAIQKKGVIIPNPVKGDLPKRHTGERRKAVITACRLHPQKNLKMMIDAFVMFHREFREYKLEIYGQGVLEKELKEYTVSLGAEEYILFLGFEPHIEDKMADCSIYISSSDYEGISNSMLEAMGMGLPVVVTDCPVGGARMVIENGKNGILVPVGDARALYLGMKEIIQNPEFAKTISQNASLIRYQFPLKKIAGKWIEYM